MPKLVRLYIQSVAIGFAVAAVFTGLLVWQDVAGIGHLVMGSDIGWIAVSMLIFFNGIVFSSVQFAVSVMGMAADDGPSGGLRDQSRMIPIRVEVVANDTRQTPR
jgi:TRAP-type C4-dicarboxylate transport system permease small subunit